MARKPKSVSLPKIRRSDVDLEHIVASHTEGGARAGSSKTLFPEGWTEKQIESAVLAAYNAGKRVLTQGDRVKVNGESDGLTLEIWVNNKNEAD